MNDNTDHGALSAIIELGNIIAGLRLELTQALQDCADYDADLRDLQRATHRPVTWEDVAALMEREGVVCINATSDAWWAHTKGAIRNAATLADAVAAAQQAAAK
jgi:hypothetical protein